MPRRLALPLFVLVASFALLRSGLPADAAGGERASPLPAGAYAVDAGPVGSLVAQHPAQPSSISSCDDLVSPERELALEESDLEPEGARGRPYLCLLYYPEDDIYWAVIVRFDGTAQFRAAKESAARRLEESGFDLCGIGTWEGYGRFGSGDSLSTDDRLNLPVECSPRVVGADPGAEVRAEAVSAALDRSREVTAEQMGWRPNRALTVIVMTDVNVAVRIYRRYTSGPTAAQTARDGRSASIRVSIFGGLILANLTKSAEPAAIDAFLMHEYTHFTQGGITGSNDHLPKWFIEGQAIFQESRNTTSDSARFLDRIAQRAQRDGTALRLAEISTPDDWNTQERKGPSGTDAAYSRGYAAYAFLEKRHGFELTLQLMRDNHNGSIERFNELLAGLTGFDLTGLDGVIGVWLVTGEIPTAQTPVAVGQPAAPPPAPTPATPTTGAQPPPTRTPAAPAPSATPSPQPAPPQPTAVTTPGPANARFVATDAAGFIRIDLTTNAAGTAAEGTLRIERPIPCNATRPTPTGQANFTVTFQPNGSFMLIFQMSGITASVTLDGRFFGTDELRGSVRVTYTDAACDTGLIAFVGRRS